MIGLLNPEGGREWLYTLALAWARAQVGRLRLGYPHPSLPPPMGLSFPLPELRAAGFLLIASA